MSLLAQWLGISRAGLYKSARRFQIHQDLSRVVLDFVDAERAINKKIGGIKLHQLFGQTYPELAIGRDRFFMMLSEHGRLLRRKSRKRAKRSPAELRARDLAHQLTVTGPAQLWVHDDTEVVTKDGKAHLALSTDAYSSMVMGYSWSRRADAGHVKAALEMALKGYSPRNNQLIHHSDNGRIYTSKAYQLLLESIQVSYSPPGRPDRNPIAERINQTFKQEYLCDSKQKSFEQIAEELPRYIQHYNHRRPHMSCDYGPPALVQSGQLQPVKHWRQRPKTYEIAAGAKNNIEA
ncbi:IS3 family transposase [Gracilimonas sp.]|uniref:IS3 family transposase n=1 Tax=Gracilimonas sp. TaxID=1974203 RepID=UPI00287181C1|nr:IS3 family transposase [Gracilimonas sp.]